MRRKFMNQITHKNFGLFQTELLQVDFSTFKLNKISNFQLSQLATYFRRLEFSFYIKERDKIQKRTSIFDDKYFEVTFVLYTPYHAGTHLEFAEESANKLYFLIKTTNST